MDFTQQVEELDKQTDIEARKRFQEGRKTDAWMSVRQSVAAFRKAYFTEKSCREGVPGFFRAVHAGMFHFLSYAKHWELQRDR